MNRLVKWARRRRFIKAYHILRDEAEAHQKAGHQMRFIMTNESYVEMICENCPDLQP